ncbi:MAG: hypothetical protein ACRCXX_04040 [Cetobacterium sp.]|uniref:hypothetical protein n=1 Tax=Cetobacterium sp. TaxID=2071632 RepID=UPI003F3DD2D2
MLDANMLGAAFAQNGADMSAVMANEPNECYIYNADASFETKLNYKRSEVLENTHWYSEWKEGMQVFSHEIRHPKVHPETGEIVSKERIELIQEGIESLNPGEYISDGVIIEVPRPEGLYEYVWNETTLSWEEGKTEEEIAQIQHEAHVRYYNAELEFASKATAELKCGIITEEDFVPVAEYMRSIDPYAPAVVGEGPTVRTTMKFSLPGTPQSRSTGNDTPTRPSIFDRYK